MPISQRERLMCRIVDAIEKDVSHQKLRDAHRKYRDLMWTINKSKYVIQDRELRMRIQSLYMLLV